MGLEQHEIEDLDGTETRLRRILESSVADFIAVFRTDLATFLEREVRNRFVANEAFAEAMGDDALRALIARSRVAAGEAAAAICDELVGDMDFWFGEETPVGDGKSMDAHLPLMEALQAVVSKTVEVLQEFDFPEDQGGGFEMRYAPPAYFVNGKYAPGLAEAFWKHLAQLNEVREARRQADVGRRRAAQRFRWDSLSNRGAKG